MSAFDRLAAKLAQRPGVTDPRGLAAKIGRERYGSKVMARASAKGISAQTAQKQMQGK